MRQPGTAAEVDDKINNAVREVHTKLEQEGFEPLGPWEKTGMGDIVIALKHRFYQHDQFALAYQTGVVLATGSTEDPDILTDLPMGDGQQDLFFQFTMDEFIAPRLVINQFAKYTYQAPGKRQMRLATEIEAIRVEKANVDFKLGDKFDAGTSIMYETTSGYQMGVGIKYHRKFGDRIYDVDEAVEYWNTRESVQSATYSEARIGYSTVAAFQRKEFPLPFSVNFDYQKQLASKHRPITDFYALDINLFF
jgi:hypothetical protein